MRRLSVSGMFFMLPIILFGDGREGTGSKL